MSRAGPSFERYRSGPARRSHLIQAEDQPIARIPERNLVVAVIQRAYLDLCQCPPDKWRPGQMTNSGRGEFQSPEVCARHAHRWIQTRDMRDWGYAWACEQSEMPLLTVDRVLEIGFHSLGRMYRCEGKTILKNRQRRLAVGVRT